MASKQIPPGAPLPVIGFYACRAYRPRCSRTIRFWRKHSRRDKGNELDAIVANGDEYELDLLRQRSVEARRAKTQRGELIVAAPVGYIKTEDQDLEKDPGRRVQQAIALVFEKLLELGSVRQTLLWLLEQALATFPRARSS
jgi:hypothetical protein